MTPLKPPPHLGRIPSYLVPKIRRLPREKRLTIAAGFTCDEGLVLCADTQETITGYVKTDTEKIRVFLGLQNMVFTGAGDSDLIEMTIEEIYRALSNHDPTAIWPLEKVFRDALSEVFRKRIGPYSVFPSGDPDRPDIPDLLIGVQLSSATLLYKARGTKLRRIRGAECVGAGLVLAKNLIARLFDPSMSLAQTGIIAAYILHRVKTGVDSCGGKSDILLLSNRDKKIDRIQTKEIQTLEAYFEDFDSFIRPVLIAASDGTVSHDSYEKIMEDFRVNVLSLRGRFMEMDDFIRHLCEIRGLSVPDFIKKDSSSPST